MERSKGCYKPYGLLLNVQVLPFYKQRVSAGMTHGEPVVGHLISTSRVSGSAELLSDFNETSFRLLALFEATK